MRVDTGSQAYDGSDAGRVTGFPARYERLRVYVHFYVLRCFRGDFVAQVGRGDNYEKP
jgi:hypothetical protein